MLGADNLIAFYSVTSQVYFKQPVNCICSRTIQLKKILACQFLGLGITRLLRLAASFCLRVGVSINFYKFFCVHQQDFSNICGWILPYTEFNKLVFKSIRMKYLGKK